MWVFEQANCFGSSNDRSYSVVELKTSLQKASHFVPYDY